MLALTLSLGVWQVERLAWKTGLLARIDQAEAGAPVPLPALPLPFEKVVASGIWRDDLSARYGAEVRGTPGGPAMGAQWLTPLERPGAAPILVDRGWVPDGALVPHSGAARVVGYVRPPEKAGWLAPKPDVAGRRFWSLDPATIGAALGLPGLAPFTLVALGPQDAMPAPAQALPRPPNDHLGYALTWFGLSACLVGVFAAYVWRTLRA